MKPPQKSGCFSRPVLCQMSVYLPSTAKDAETARQNLSNHFFQPKVPHRSACLEPHDIATRRWEVSGIAKLYDFTKNGVVKIVTLACQKLHSWAIKMYLCLYMLTLCLSDIRGSLDFLLVNVGEGPIHGHPLLQCLDRSLPEAKFLKNIFEVFVRVDTQSIASVSLSF